MIRKALLSDLPELTAIYNQAIESRRCTGETVCFTAEARLPWFHAHSSEKNPIWVFESAQGVAAYATISPYRPGRQAFEQVGEISYYVDFSNHGKGIGSRLLAHLIDEAKRNGYTHLLAILLGCNNRSIALAEKFGFHLWGTLPELACIDGERYAHLYYGIALNALAGK